MANRLKTLPKYVASTTLKDPQWANTTVLKGDLASAVRELKDSEASWGEAKLDLAGGSLLFIWH